MKKQMLAVALIGMMTINILFGQANVNAEGKMPFSDIENHWAKEQILTKYNQKMVSGYPDGEFKPDNELTVGELITLINRHFGLSNLAEDNYEDVKENDWFADETAKAKYYNYIRSKKVHANEKAKRIEVVEMLASLLDIEAEEVSKSQFNDMDNLSKKQKGMIENFAKLGYINGFKDGSFKPNDTLKRAEIVTILDNVVGYIVKEQKDVENIPEGKKVTIIGNGVVLENKELKDVYISPGVDSEITIRKTKIGNLVVGNEGKQGSLNLEDISVDNLKIRRSAKKLDVKIKGDTHIRDMSTENEGSVKSEKEIRIYKIAIKKGRQELRNINVSRDLLIESGEVELENSRVDDLVVEGECEIEIDEDTIVYDLEAKAEAEIRGKGKIKEAYIRADGVELGIKPKYLKVRSGIKTDVAGKSVTSKNDYPRERHSSKLQQPQQPQQPVIPVQGTQVRLEGSTWVVDNVNGTHTGIWKIEDLARVGTEGEGTVWELSDKYVVMENLDFKNSNSYRSKIIDINYTSGLGFKPIADIEAMNFTVEDTPPFTGEFDGNNKIITNLYINRPTFSDENKEDGGITVGLFGGIMKATIKNVNLKNINIIGANRVGGIAGGAMMSSITNCSVSGKAEGKAVPEKAGDENFVGRTTSVGGLLGMTYVKGIKIEDCSSSVDVKGTDAVGGLVGYNYGNPIIRSYATGNVEGDNFVGGLAGVNVGTAVMMPPPPSPPKFTTYIKGEIEKSYAAGNVCGNNHVGGLIGYNHVYTNVRNSYALGEIEGQDKVGGLIGHNNATGGVEGVVENCYAIGSVKGVVNVAGLIGINRDSTFGKIKNCIAFNEKVESDNNVGRVLASGEGTANCYAYIDMNVIGDANAEKGLDVYVNDFKDINTYDDVNGKDGLKEWDFTIWKISGERPVLKDVGNDTGNLSFNATPCKQPLILGAGSKENSFIIRNVEGLVAIGCRTVLNARN